MSEFIRKITQQFLDNQKSLALEKKISQEIKVKKSKYEKFISEKNKNLNPLKLDNEKEKYDSFILNIREKYEEEFHNKYSLVTWLPKAIDKSSSNITTHPAKFTNPKISKVTSVKFFGNYAIDGYVKSGNAYLSEKIDVSGDSAKNSIIFELYSYLNFKIHDNKKIIDLVNEDDSGIIELFESLDIEYKIAKSKCLNVFYGESKEYSSHDLIKQIYFPCLTSNEYHLLSIVMPSPIMFEFKKRIDAMDVWIDGDHIRELKKKNKFYKEGFNEVLDLTMVGFSHKEYTKMGNVSFLNVKNKGISYLFSCCPPNFEHRSIRRPAQNFFVNTLRISDFKKFFQVLHELMEEYIQNKNDINDTLKCIIDLILEHAFQVRASGIGWSATEHYKDLPLAQRIWLDDSYIKERENIEVWLDTICSAFACWIIQAYEKTLKKESIKLGDAELQHIRDFVNDAVKQDKEFFK